MTRIHMPRRTLIALAVVLPAWVACADAPTGPAGVDARQESAASRAQSARLSTVWQTKAGELVASHRLSPLAAGRVYGLLGAAQYGAVLDADFGGGVAQYEARRGAVAGASEKVLSALFPDATTSLAQMVVDQGNAGPGNTHPHFTRGVATGRAMGDDVNRWAANDGFAAPWDGVPLPTGPGMWRQAPGVAPAGFQFPAMRSYVLQSASQFRPAPPPAFGSADFLAALAFVRHTTDTRGPNEVAIANFWNQSVGPPTTAGYWMARGGALASAAGLDERETAHLYALIGVSMTDAAIGCFEAKYHYLYIRPSQADPLITQPLGPPGFPYTLPNHPSYPSGHSCLSGSAVGVLAAWFPQESSALLAQMAEAGMSRIYGGLHYQFDVSAGQMLGRNTASWVMSQDAAHALLSRISRD